MKDLVLVVI